MSSRSSTSSAAEAEEPRKKASRGGKRSVTRLSKAQLARKRANDREAQRNIRQRTKEHIENLEKKVKELEGGSRSSSMDRVLQRNQELEAEIDRLRSQLFSTTSTPPQIPTEISDDLCVQPKTELEWMPEHSLGWRTSASAAEMPNSMAYVTEGRVYPATPTSMGYDHELYAAIPIWNERQVFQGQQHPQSLSKGTPTGLPSILLSVNPPGSQIYSKQGSLKCWNDGGNIIGKAELVPDSERSGNKEGIFSGFDGLKVNKDGKVTDSKDVIVGRLTEGDAQKLYGKAVDEDGDVLDSNGNSVGKAERWQEEEKKVSRHPAAGRKVNKKGEVVDENGDTIAKLTEGELTKCAGKEIDADGDVVDGKGSSVGHVTLLEDIPEPEPEPEPEPVEEEPKETEEQIAERKQLEQDKKLAKQMTNCISQSLDKIKPILAMITDAINVAEAKPKDELDEQKLVETVKPLIEQGSAILNEANGVIRGLDPDGRLQANAKGKTSGRDATSEEHQLAEVLKELSGSVTQTIEQAKKKIAGMPHAKKELNPLWGLLAEPLGQILAAVGLLLSGVLGLVGKLLSVLGLGVLLDNLLGGLGIKGILKGLGLGSVTDSLTGKK